MAVKARLLVMERTSVSREGGERRAAGRGAGPIERGRAPAGLASPLSGFGAPTKLQGGLPTRGPKPGRGGGRPWEGRTPTVLTSHLSVLVPETNSKVAMPTRGQTPVRR